MYLILEIITDLLNFLTIFVISGFCAIFISYLLLRNKNEKE
jgi:hypothetical protein